MNRVDPDGEMFEEIRHICKIAKIVCCIKESFRVDKELSERPEPSNDITLQLDILMLENRYEIRQAIKNEGYKEACKLFYLNVRNKGKWDLKQQPQYKGTFSYNGIVVEGQDIGNINFGYTGKALGLPDEVLLMGAGAAQIKAGTSKIAFLFASYGDDLRDQMYIAYGIKLYEEQWG